MRAKSIDKADQENELRAEALKRYYVPSLLPHVPGLVSRLDLKSWDRVLDVVYQKHRTLDDLNRVGVVKDFSQEFVESLAKVPDERVLFYLDQLLLIGKLPVAVRRKVDLEELLMREMSKGLGELDDSQISGINLMFLNGYAGAKRGHVESARLLPEVYKTVIGIPKELRDRAILYSGNMLKLGSDLQVRNTLLDNFLPALAVNLPNLKDKFGEWFVGATRGKEPGKIVEYLQDRHQYFRSDLESVVGGLSLSSVAETLAVYSQALTGRAVEIKDSQTSNLICAFDRDKFVFPSMVNAFSNPEKNFSVFKAMASYQVGAHLFGTYELDESRLKPEIRKGFSPGEFFNSFDNPDFAKFLFDLLEFSRIDSRLVAKFPGLVGDVEVFRNLVASSKEGEGDLGKLTRKLVSYVCGKGELDRTVAGEIDRVRQGTNVADSVNAVGVLYKILGKDYDFSVKFERPEERMSFNLEQAVVDNGTGRGSRPLVAEAVVSNSGGKKYRYDEWDVDGGRYKERFVQVTELPYPKVIPNNYVGKLLETDADAIHRLRGIFERLAPQERTKVRRQLSGDIDYNELVKARMEMAAGITPSEKIYTREYKNNRSVAVMVSSELSGSLGKFFDIGGSDLRILDITKRAQVYLGQALDIVGDSYALAVYSGQTEKDVKFYLVKDFDKPFDESTRHVIGSLRPLEQNRDGAGIRHSTALLSQRDEKTKILFHLMEGVPHDFGYEGRYAIEDTRMAISEASRYCVPVVLAFGKNINPLVRSLSDSAIYREVSDARMVPETLTDLYRRIAF